MRRNSILKNQQENNILEFVWYKCTGCFYFPETDNNILTARQFTMYNSIQHPFKYKDCRLHIYPQDCGACNFLAKGRLK